MEMQQRQVPVYFLACGRDKEEPGAGRRQSAPVRMSSDRVGAGGEIRTEYEAESTHLADARECEGPL